MQLVVGRIGKPHGIRGELTVEVRTDAPEIRFAPGSVLATDPARVGPLTVAAARWHSGRLLLRVEGVADRNAAEALRGVVVSAEVPDDEQPDDPEEFYDHQLRGLAVVTVDGAEVGAVDAVVHLPAQDLLSVRRPDGREVLVPFVSAIVPEIDVEAGRVVIAPPPGLLDLDEAETAGAPGDDDAAEGEEGP
ncbi:MAG: ribosome maturation factor RimM [Candidatus Nanopelagicales bacterium]